MTDKNAPSQVAVWYFVGATFAFASTLLFFTGEGLFWLRIVMLVLGLLLVVVGSFVFSREISAQKAVRRPDESAPPLPPPPPGA